MKFLNFMYGLSCLLICTMGFADFPEKPITIIIPYPKNPSGEPGGATDNTIFAIAKAVGRELGVPIIPIYIGGEQTAVAYKRLAASPPDGYTLAMASTNMHALKERGIAPVGLDDFTLIVQLTVDPIAFYVSAKYKFKNFNDFIDYIREHPGKLKGSGDVSGGISHFSFLETFKELNLDPKTSVKWVYTKNIVQGIEEMKAGDLDFMTPTLGEGIGLKESKVAVPLAIAASERSPISPDTPTLMEQVHIKFSIQHWNGIIGPKGIPEDIVNKLEAAFLKACEDPETRKEFEKRHLTPACLSRKLFSEKINKLNPEIVEILNEYGLISQKKS